MIALFIAGFFCMFIAFTTGVVGCWKTAPGHIVSSAIMMLLACKYLYILAKLRLPTGQRQENFNFGPSLLKF